MPWTSCTMARAQASRPIASTTTRVRRLVHEGYSRVVLDLARVRYVDSAGLGDLVQAVSAARTRGGAIKLVNVTTRLNDLLVVTKLLTVFECLDQEDEAVASFAAPTGGSAGRLGK